MQVLKNNRTVFSVFIIVWAAINLLQAGFTDLNSDEAYYWMYSRQLDWGYFDHPPMIALMIKIGYLIFHSEVGVRLVTVVLMVGTLAIVWRLIDTEPAKSRNLPYFIILAVMLPAFSIFGFMATPDSPLMFFAALFLLSYKRFLENESWQNAALISLSAAAMMYSKYHAVLLLVFTVLSNIRLLLRPKFIAATAAALLLFMPHMLWQFRNEFPTFRYHLVDRAAGINFSYVPEYIGNLFVFQNPVILFIALWLIFRKKIEDRFKRALVFIVCGFILFFFAESLRYRIQPQWTTLMALPVFILVFDVLENHLAAKKAVRITAVIMIPLIVVARLALAVDFLPVAFVKKDYHDYRKKMLEIQAVTGDLPVVFSNSYQTPSMYAFYTGKSAHSLNEFHYRKTQYDLWDFEEQLHGKRVVYIPHWPMQYFEDNFMKHFFVNGDSIYMKEYPAFMSLSKECAELDENSYTFTADSLNRLSFSIHNPYPYPLNLATEDFPVSFYLGFFSNGSIVSYSALEIADMVSTINPGDTVAVECRFTPGSLPEGRYRAAICCQTGILYMTLNSPFSDAVIEI